MYERLAQHGQLLSPVVNVDGTCQANGIDYSCQV